MSAELRVQVTVLSIAALKKVSRGTRILLLDRNGGQSKAIAKALAKKGFKKVPSLCYCAAGQGLGGFPDCSVCAICIELSSLQFCRVCDYNNGSPSGR